MSNQLSGVLAIGELGEVRIESVGGEEPVVAFGGDPAGEPHRFDDLRGLHVRTVVLLSRHHPGIRGFRHAGRNVTHRADRVRSDWLTHLADSRRPGNCPAQSTLSEAMQSSTSRWRASSPMVTEEKKMPIRLAWPMSTT